MRGGSAFSSVQEDDSSCDGIHRDFLETPRKQTIRFDVGKEALVTGRLVQFDLAGVLSLIGKLSGFQLNFHATFA